MTFDTLYANPFGRTSRGTFIGALIALLAVAAFYFTMVKGRTGEWCLIVLLFPAVVLHARRLHDMGLTAWLLIVPVAPTIAGVWMHLAKRNPELQPTVSLVALGLGLAVTLWCLVGKGKPGGDPAAA